MEPTHLYFLGEAALANGFRLAGFEVYPDADIESVETLLRGLIEARSHAFVVLDHRLAETDNAVVRQVRMEGGRILLTQVPPLNAPDSMHSSIDVHIAQLLGEQENTQ